MSKADISYKATQCDAHSAALWAEVQRRHGPAFLAVVRDVLWALESELDSLLDGEPARIERSDIPGSEYERGWRNGYATVVDSLKELIPSEDPPGK